MATAEALAPVFGVDRNDDDRMIGLMLLANGLVNLELTARAWGKQDPPAPPTGPPEEDAGG